MVPRGRSPCHLFGFGTPAGVTYKTLTLCVRNLSAGRCVVKDVMTRFAKLRYLRVAGLAAGAVAVTGTAVLVTASAAGLNVGFRPTSQPKAETASISQQATASAVCTDFLSHLSKDLGKTQIQVNSAIQKAIGETLADEVKNKTLTQAQADAIKQKLSNQPPCSLAGSLGPKAAPGSAVRPAAYTQQLLSAAASALGIGDALLKTDLAKGMSLSQIAAAHNPPVTEAQFRTSLIAKLKPLLDTAVTNKQVTSAQEQAILKRLQTGPIPLWSKSPPRKTTAPATPVTTTTI